MDGWIPAAEVNSKGTLILGLRTPAVPSRVAGPSRLLANTSWLAGRVDGARGGRGQDGPRGE